MDPGEVFHEVHEVVVDVVGVVDQAVVVVGVVVEGVVVEVVVVGVVVVGVVVEVVVLSLLVPIISAHLSLSPEPNDDIHPESARELRSGRKIFISGRCPILEIISSN